MRECTFCGTPAPEDDAATCALCGSPLAPVSVEGTAPVSESEPPFDAGATVASPPAAALPTARIEPVAGEGAERGAPAEIEGPAIAPEPAGPPPATAAEPEAATPAAETPPEPDDEMAASTLRARSRTFDQPAPPPAVPPAEERPVRVEPSDDSWMVESTAGGGRSGLRLEPPSPPPPAHDTGIPLPDDAPTVVPMPGAADGPPGDDSGKTAVLATPIIGVECKVCGAANDPVSAFCVRCGARLGDAPAGPEAASPGFAASGPSFREQPAPDIAEAPTVVPEPRQPGGPAARTGAAPPQVRCPQCRTLNDAAGAFCISCGASLRPAPAPAPPARLREPPPLPVPPPPGRATPPPTPVPPPASPAQSAAKACPSCGVANDPGTRFCISCGTSLTRDGLAGQRAPETPATARDPFARPGAPPPPAPARASDPFGRGAAVAPPPPTYAAPQPIQPSYTPAPGGGGGRMGVLIVIGVIAGAAIGAGVALGLMTLFDVSPF